MTSRRGLPTRARWRRWLAAASAVAALSGCAALPEDQPVMEEIDNQTGVTVTRLGKPVEIFRETFLSQAPGRFGFIGPFETNHMGTREIYLWIAVPVDPAPNAEPRVIVDGEPLTLGEGSRELEFAGLRKPPYRVATPWSATFYYRIDAASVARLGTSNQVLVEIFEATKDGAARIEFAAAGGDERLRAFANRD
jgi:hypothetical protein